MAWCGLAQDLKLAPDLRARVEAVAARSSRSADEVIADALRHGHSLTWQERFVEEVAAGRADIAAGRVATPGEVDRVRNTDRPS